LKKIHKILDNINYDLLFPCFKKEKYYIIDEKNKKYGTDISNTVIFDNDYIAIWNTLKFNEYDEYEIISGLIHEMFHIYQLKNIIPFRKLDNVDRNYFLKEEIDELYDLFMNQNYKKIISIYKNKYNYYPNLFREDIEGSAMYVELKFREIYYNKSIEYNIEKIYNSIQLGRMDLICYLKGTLVCLILDHFVPTWKEIYNKEKILIRDILVYN